MNNLSDKNIMEMVLSDTGFEKNAALEIEQMIDNEMSKPGNKRDYNKVRELTTAYSEITGADKELSKFGVDEIISATRQNTKNKSTHTRKFKLAIPLAIAATLMVVANCITVVAYDMNIVSAIIHITKGGFSVEFKDDNNNVIDIPTSENDPYGLIAECAKYEIYPEVPYYIPEGFELTHTYNDEDKKESVVTFVFTNGNQSIGIDFTHYWNEVIPVGIPSDEYNISETTVNGHNAIVSKEDDQYTITYIDENKTEFFMFTIDVPYDECEKIVASIK